MLALRFSLLLIVCLGLVNPAEAVGRKKPPSASAPAARQPSPLPVPETRRSQLPVATAVSTASGQAGYVHYFLITHPDESLEYHVGIELSDQRIAWSFPGVGVSVVPFIASGSLEVNGVAYSIEHLYGIRPFPGDARMKTLQDEIGQRVAQWIDDEIPYCGYRTRGGPFCVSCGDFVVRLLFPGRTFATPNLPRDFFRAPAGTGPSTDDLLLFLLGLNELPSKDARIQRVAALSLPPPLREDISELLTSMDADVEAEPAVARSPRTVRRLRAGTRPSQKVVQDPPASGKRM